MRKRSLLPIGLAFLGLMALCLSVPNTAATQEVTAGPRPTPTAAALPPDYAPSTPPQPDVLPDLVVDSIRLSNPNPYVNQEVTIYVTIRNAGDQDVEPGNNFFLDFYINPQTDDLRGLRGDVYWPVQGHTMRVGQTATFTTMAVFTDSAAYNLWAQVDTPEYGPPPFPAGHVLESNEDNNILGPQYTRARTRNAWVQKNHTDFFRNMASTLEVVPSVGTVGIITNTPGLVIDGDSALALGIFDEPPKHTWGMSPTLSITDMIDYNMLEPDARLNYSTTQDQRNVAIHAAGDLVVAVWEDGRNGPTYGKDIFMRWSDDAGETWQPADDDIMVNETYLDGDRNDQKHPSLAVSEDGKVVIAWQDHRGPSFDIYVQAYDFSGGSPLRCHSNGDCTAACNPATQPCNTHVDTDANERDQIVPDVAVDKAGHFYIAWQDQRNYNDDIFAVRSYYTTTAPCPIPGEGLGFAPKPRIVESETPDQLHLCWGDDTRIDDDASTTRQGSPSINAVDGVRVTGFDYFYDPITLQLIVTHVYSEPTTYVVATWEDWREGDADIYLTYSDDDGETFVLDQRLNDDKPDNWTNGIGQYDPAVAINQWMKTITLVLPTPYGDASGPAEVPVTTMHIVWQDMRHSTNSALNNNPDIYYNTITVEPDSMFPWPVTFNNEGQEQVNSNDRRAWQSEPVWQGEPDVAATPSGLTLAESDAYNAFVVWSDGRNYGVGDFDNNDIYFRLFSSHGEPTEFIGGNNLMVNDNVRLHDFDTNVYTTYRVDMPPHARQQAPAIAATLIADWPTIFGGYVFVAWDDDRTSNPFFDRNVYMSRSNMMFGGHYRTFDCASPLFDCPPETPGQGERYASGAFVSEVFDSLSPETVWYIVDWHGVTDSGTYITLQTRLGDTREEVLASDWYPKRFPYPNDALGPGSPLQGYDAPGQHIEDASGNYFPEARYIQYRVNMWARNAADIGVSLYTPFVYDVIIHYERPPIIFLPILLKRYAGG